MTRTLNIIALTFALAMSTTSDSLAAEQSPGGSGTGLGAPQARTTRADCVNSFHDELRWCSNQFANDDIARASCVSGAETVLEDCLSTL